jgi:hypothetical protein
MFFPTSGEVSLELYFCALRGTGDIDEGKNPTKEA